MISWYTPLLLHLNTQTLFIYISQIFKILKFASKLSINTKFKWTNQIIFKHLHRFIASGYRTNNTSIVIELKIVIVMMGMQFYTAFHVIYVFERKLLFFVNNVYHAVWTRISFVSKNNFFIQYKFVKYTQQKNNCH